MYWKVIEEEDSIYELDDECINQRKEERENKILAGWEQREKEKKK